MSVKQSCENQCNSSTLNLTVDGVLQVLKIHEEEVEKLDKKKESLKTEVGNQKSNLLQLELEKNDIDAEISSLKLRNVAYQKEHTNLRNAITVVKFQIDKIKESIAKAKVTELKDLEEFEKKIDEITEKFRSSPDVYDRKIILENIQKEKEKNDLLLKRVEDLRSSYQDFCRHRGLRLRTDENEDLLNCVLPGSTTHCLMEMTKNFDEIISDLKKRYKDVKYGTDASAAVDTVHQSEKFENSD